MPAHVFASKVLCNACGDFRYQANHYGKAQPCKFCGPEAMKPEEYQDWSRKKMGLVYPVPELTLEDLTPEQKKLYARMKLDFPHAATRTLLSWVEGASYDPAKDPDFNKPEILQDWRIGISRQK